MKTRLLCFRSTLFAKWRYGLSRCLKSIPMLFLFSILLFSSKSFAQVAPVTVPSNGFDIDGNLDATNAAGDWLQGTGGPGTFVLDGTSAGAPLNAGTTFHIIDLYNSGTDDNFAGGNKFNDNPNSWTWVKNPVGAKVDINNGLVHFSKDLNNHLWVMVAADRRSDNGDAYMDFEFLQNTLTINSNGTFTSAGPNGGRTVNDFVLTLKLTSGGSTATFSVERWQQISPGVYDYVSVPFPSSTYAAVNAADGTPVSFGAFGANTYKKNTFAEAAVDLTALIGSFDPCLELGIKSLFIKTKVSASDDATIVDFISPSLPVSLTLGAADAGADQSLCGLGSADFQLAGIAVPPPNDAIAQTTWSVVGGSATFDDINDLNTIAHVTTASATIRLTVTFVNATCSPAVHDDVILKVVSSPTIFDVSATDYCVGDPAHGEVTLSNSEGGISYQLYDGDDNTVQAPKPGVDGSLTWTDIPAGTYYIVATATGGCNSSTGEATVQENGVPDEAAADVTQPTCSTATGTITVTSPTGEGLTYSIDGLNYQSDLTFNNVAPGDYTILVKNSSGCTSSGTPVTVNAQPVTPDPPSVDVVDNCDGSSTLTAGNYTGSLLWSTNETTESISVNTAGTYTVTQTANGCTSAAGSGDANPKTAPGAPSVGVVDNCDGTSTLTASDYTGSLLWSTNETTASITVSSAGTYTVTQTVAGCTSASGSGDANPKTAPAAPSVGVVNNCNGTSTLTASGYTGSLLWSTNETTASITVSSAGTYTVTQTVAGCTSASGSGVANPKTTPAAPTVSGTTVCSPNSAVASASGCSGTLTWYDAATGGNVVATSVSSITTSTTKTYYVSCTVNGCESARKAVTATVNVCSGIYPTSSSCAGFNSGTLQFLSRVCVTTKKKGSTTSVTNATPGVFFYYTNITAPAADFYVYVDETQCGSINKPFLIASGQLLAYKSNCTKLAAGTIMTNGDGVIHITKATAGQPVTIGVKYDVKSIVGATVTGSFPCTANFVVRLGTTNAAPVIPNTSSDLIIGANCSVAAVASTLETTDELKVSAYPNPYKSQVSFKFTSPVSGKAVLEAYDLMGKRLAVIFEGNVDAGVERVVTYNVAANSRVTIMYKLTVGDKSYHAMLVPEK